MFELARIAGNIKAKLTTLRSLEALAPADATDFGVTPAELVEAAQQRGDVLERITRMSEIYGVEQAFQAVGRYDLLEMARKCNRCPHERACARLLRGECNPCTKQVDFCPNAGAYAALIVGQDAAHVA